MSLKASFFIFFVLLIPTFMWNDDLFLFFNGWNNPFADKIIGVWSGFGDGLVITILVLMLILFHFRLGLAGAGALIVASIISQIIKRILEVPRPPAIFDDVHLLGHSLYNYSFPSGHATTCGVMALLALFVWHKNQLAWLVFGIFFIAAYGRIYGGVHFPLDMLVGFSIGLLTMYWFEKKSRQWTIECWQQSEWSWKIPGLLLMISAVVLGTGYEVKPNTAQILALILPIIALFALMQAWKKRLH